LFGHHSLSETSFGTDSVDLFFTATGIAATGGTFPKDTDFVMSAGSSISALEEGYKDLGTAPILSFDELLLTKEETISKIESAFGFGQISATRKEELTSFADASSFSGGILYASNSSDKLVQGLKEDNIEEFSETDSFSGVAAKNLQGRSLFGSMVATFNSSGIQTTNMGVVGTGEVGQVLVWGNLEISQDPSYTAITPSQSPSYSTVTPSQSPSYSQVTPSQSPSYSKVTPSQTPSWDS
tara:strand:+ start:57 stop:776 length:720 start_codon:yes stop_codon:yes gene_type:complete